MVTIFTTSYLVVILQKQDFYMQQEFQIERYHSPTIHRRLGEFGLFKFGLYDVGRKQTTRSVNWEMHVLNCIENNSNTNVRLIANQDIPRSSLSKILNTYRNQKVQAVSPN